MPLKDLKKLKTELLAPAGSFDCARAAVNAGADAVYMGGPMFSARAYAESSGAGPEELIRSLEYCHLRGARLYMTVNTLLKDAELEQLEVFLSPYVRAGVDGVIVQDLGVMLKLRECFPGLKLHMSTQAAVSGPRYAAMLLRHGASRIVLPRELSLSQIRRIYDETGAELEVFIHGAMCYSYSGQCLLSSMIGGRSGNRGRCAGPCRLCYDVYDSPKQGRRLLENSTCLSMKDLETVSRLEDILEAGACSLKIEGRMKPPVYVAGVTGVYRKYLDLAETELYGKERRERSTPRVVDPEDLAVLHTVFDRGSSCGYLEGNNGREMIALKEKPQLRVPDAGVIRQIKERYLDQDKKVPVRAELFLELNSPARLRLSAGETTVEAVSAETVVQARKAPVTDREVRERIVRLGETDFEAQEITVHMEKDLFVTVRTLNELKRSAAQALKEAILAGHH